MPLTSDEKFEALGHYAQYFNLTAPLVSDESENWLKTRKWNLPKTGPALLDSLGVANATKDEQRQAIALLNASGRMAHAPKNVIDYLTQLELLDS